MDSLTNLNNLLNSLGDEIDNNAVEFDEFGRQLSAQEARTRAFDNARQAAIKKRIEKEEAEFNAKVRRYNELSKFATSSAAGMVTQEGAFTTLANVAGMAIKGLGNLLGNIPVLGSALKGLSGAVAEAFKLIAAETSKAFQTFGKLSGSGIVSDFEDLKNAARNTGLLFAELEGVLAKNSEALTLLGGTSLQGSKRLQQILNVNNVSSQKYAEQFQKIGMSFAEFSEIQASYVSQQIKAGMLKGKSDQDVAKNAREYALNLDTLSKLTGKQRKEIQKEQEKLESNTRFRAYLVELESQGPEGERKAQVLRDLYSVIGEGAREGIMDIVVSGGAITTDAAAQVAIQLGQGGLDVVKFAKDFNQGAITTDIAMNQLSTAADNYKKEMGELTTVIGTGSELTKGFVNMANLAMYAGKNFSEAKKIFEQERKAIMEAADPMAEAGKKSHDIAREVEDYLTRSKGVPKAIDAMADGMLKLGKVIEGVVKKFGGTVTTVDQTPAETARLQSAAASNQDTQQVKIVREETQQALQEAKENREKLEKEHGRGSEQAKQARIEEHRKQQEARRATYTEISTARNKHRPVTGNAAQPEQPSQPTSQNTNPSSRRIALPTSSGVPVSTPTSGTLVDAGSATPATKPPSQMSADENTQMGNRVKIGNTIREGGTVSWRTNNPGNVSYGELAKRYGAIGRWIKPDGDLQQRTTGIAIMPTIEAGDALKMALWRRPLYSDTNIATGTHLWTRGSKSPELPPDIKNYASDLAKAAGVRLDTSISDLSNDQLARLVKKQRFWEGFKEGNIIAAANGAVVKPNTGGTLVQVAEAGQAEAIIPMQDGKTIPVNVTSSDNSKISSIFERINEQSEQIANLLMRGNSIEDNLAQIMV